VCIYSSSAANEATKTESVCSQHANSLFNSDSILPLAHDTSALSETLLLPIDNHNERSGSDGIDDSISSEIPFTPPPRFKSVALRTSADVEIPATTVAEISAKFPALFSGYHRLSANSPNVSVAGKCSTASVSADVHKNCSGTAAGKVTVSASAVSCGYSPLSYETHDVERAADCHTKTSPVQSKENSTSTSPPKLTSVWEEMDSIFDGPTDEMPDMFPANVEDDPPFIGFDPVRDDLSNFADAKSRCGKFSDSTFIPRKSRSVFDEDNELHVISPRRSYSVRNRQRRRLGRLADNDMLLIQSSHECLVNDDIVFNYDSPQKQPSIVVYSDTVKSAAEDCEYIGHQCVVDDDIMFNYASPQKQLGIVCSSDAKKSATKRHRIPAHASSSKPSGRRRKRLFALENSRVPSETSTHLVLQSSLKPVTDQRPCKRRKKSSFSKTSASDIDHQ